MPRTRKSVMSNAMTRNALNSLSGSTGESSVLSSKELGYIGGPIVKGAVSSGSVKKSASSSSASSQGSKKNAGKQTASKKRTIANQGFIYK